ncbi:MAG TPA: ECF-type sigma factor [Tepidisphaeraceae bacterium]|jgi:RNA polymerase sigma factor (TIGR02999 family)
MSSSGTGDSRNSDSQITLLLDAIGKDESARGRLLAAVYDELRAMARQRLRHERAGHTLQATALVHEAYLKLIGQNSLPWRHRAHFFGACANAMRQILVDHARARNARKRGGNVRPQTFDEPASDDADPSLVLAVDESLEKLRAEDARAAEVVELRFFAGLEMKEIADALETSERTVRRDWAFARARLLQMFGESDQEAGSERDPNCP